MRATIEKAGLVRALERASAATDKKHSMYAQVRVRAMTQSGEFPATLQLSSTTGLLSVQTAAPCQVATEGDLGVDCSKLLYSARSMPDGEPILLEQGVGEKSTWLSLSAGRRTHRHQVVLDEFSKPTIPQPDEAALHLDIERGTLKRIIHRVQFACPGDAFPSRDGVVVLRSEGSLDVAVVGDVMFGRLVALYDGRGTWELQMIPRLVLAALTELLEPGEEFIQLSYDKDHMFFRTQDTILATVVPAQAFLGVHRHFEKLVSGLVAEVQLSVLLKAINAMLIDPEEGVHLEFDGSGEAHLWIRGKEGQAEDWVPVANDRPWKCEVSVKLLQKMLQNCEGTVIRVRRAMNTLMLDDGAGFHCVLAVRENKDYDYAAPRDGEVVHPRPAANPPVPNQIEKDAAEREAEGEAQDSPKHRARKAPAAADPAPDAAPDPAAAAPAPAAAKGKRTRVPKPPGASRKRKEKPAAEGAAK